MADKGVKKISLGDMEAVYRFNEEGQVSFLLVPAGEDNLFLEKGYVHSLAEISCTGDSSIWGFAAGESRFDSGLTRSLRFVSQSEKEDDDEKSIVTALENEEGIQVEHVVVYTKCSRSIKVHTNVINSSPCNIMLEKISSFTLSGITPYAEDQGQNRLLLHRFRSRWSAEGRHEVRTIEELLLEPSWSNFSLRCEKFGAIGSMPIRKFFPFLAIEDKEAHVFWGITNECSSSWQMETIRYDQNLCINGGLADYEYGHWRKELKPGEMFSSPVSYLTVVKGDFDDCCERLLDVQKEGYTPKMTENRLPSVFNEFCTTWGEPSEKRIKEMLSVIKGENFDYFVIDAGWYADALRGWQDNMGEWIVSKELFPNGMKPIVEMIEANGMKAGIWFELEVVGKDSPLAEDIPHLLTRDGKVIISGTRRFWDMRSEWVNAHLTERVINFLKDNGFKYLKIDYNDTIGIGCDGADSPGEGLRQCVAATKSFYAKIKAAIPDLALEVCSSGGHRLEPGFMKLADFLSFSDAHEEKEIPVIASDLHSLILPSKSQIWAVLRKTDELKRIAYSVSAGMYGVLCISGDVFELSKEQWDFAKEGVEFYKRVSPVIAKGNTKKFGPFQESNRDLKDYRACVRYSEEGKALVVAHSFAHEGTQNIVLPLDGEYRIVEKYETGNHNITIAGREIHIEFKDNFDGVAVSIQRLCEE